MIKDKIHTIRDKQVILDRDRKIYILIHTPHIQHVPPKMERIIKLNERRINVVLKSDTKKELDKLSSSRRDSYDDIIRRLINEHYQIPATKINENMNKIISYTKLTRKENMIIINNVNIKYSFNLHSKE